MTSTLLLDSLVHSIPAVLGRYIMCKVDGTSPRPPTALQRWKRRPVQRGRRCIGCAAASWWDGGDNPPKGRCDHPSILSAICRDLALLIAHCLLVSKRRGESPDLRSALVPLETCPYGRCHLGPSEPPPSRDPVYQDLTNTSTSMDARCESWLNHTLGRQCIAPKPPSPPGTPK